MDVRIVLVVVGDENRLGVSHAERSAARVCAAVLHLLAASAFRPAASSRKDARNPARICRVLLA